MKILLILWAIGLATSDKLDRTYLPPEGSDLAGGYPQDLNLPLEYPKENLSSSLKLGNNGTSDNSLSSKYPNIALGIDRQGDRAFVTSRPKPTKKPGTFVSNNIYNIPTTAKSYEFAGTSTFVPVEVIGSTARPVTTVPQRYFSTSPSTDPNLTYDQYLIQENAKANNALRPNYFPGSNLNIPNKNIDVVSGSSNRKTANNQGNASIPYGGDLDSISKIPSTDFTSFDENPNDPTFNTFSSQGVPVESDSININSRKYYDPVDSGLSSASNPDKLFEKSDANLVPSFTYGSTPLSSTKFQYNTMSKPERVQAENDRNAVILNYENILTPEGFAYSFDTSNGIHADESGTANDGVKAKGSYSFTGDDGKIYTVEYTADENGFIPRGDHLPTAPPIPDAILKNIEIAEQNRNLGIIENGSYDNAKYGHHKYQGLMDRTAQNQYNNMQSQPNYKGGVKMTNIGSQVPAYKENGEIYDEISSTFVPNISSYSPDKSQAFEAYQKAINKDSDDKDTHSFSDNNRPYENPAFNSEAENFYNEPNTERNKFKGNIITNAPKLDEEAKIIQSTYKKQNAGGVTKILPKPYNPQNEYNSGYVYDQPQNMFTGRDQIYSGFNLPSSRKNYVTNLDGQTSDDEMEADKLRVPNTSFVDFRKQNPGTNSPILRKTFSNYGIASDVDNNGVTNPDSPIFSNNESDRIKNKQTIIPERVYPTSLDPKYVTTTRRPYNNESPYALNDYVKQSIFPSSTQGSQYSVSTTPVPSDTSLPITPSTSVYRYSTPSTSSVRYTATTPTTSQISSTLKPFVNSRRPSSNISSRLPSYASSISEPEEPDYRMSTTRPSQFGERIIGRPRNDGTRNKIPITRTGFSEDLEPGFVQMTDPRSQDLGVSSKPGNVNAQSTTESVIGEDFNGPRQPQTYDPKYGYYY